MQYTKHMIDQVFQIRKAAPDHLRAQIKLANPDLLNTLAEIYRELHDKLLRELIQQLMFMAGPSWLSLLDKPAQDVRLSQDQQIYRGQAHHQHHAESSQTPRAGGKEKMVIYRGRVVQP